MATHYLQNDKSIFVGNAHFIGGVVGLNVCGRINNTYNKINVSQINSLYAGGIIGATIGGELFGVYTTADVYAFTGIGGVVGLNAGYVGEDATSNNLYISNYDAFKNVSLAALNTKGVVAINMWKLEHLNVRRS